MINRISMVLIHDDALMCEGMLTLLRGQPGFVVLATAASAGEALRLVRTRRPDVVLVDLRPTGGDRFVLAGALHGDVPGSRTIIMGLDAGDADVSHFIRAGVSGFVMADATLATLLATASTVAQGDDVLPAELTASLFADLARRGPAPAPRASAVGEPLSRRERDVRALVVLGLSDQAIATRLRVRSPTVRRHVRRILVKSSAEHGVEVAALSPRTTRRPPARPPSDGGTAHFLTTPQLLDRLSSSAPPA